MGTGAATGSSGPLLERDAERARLARALGEAGQGLPSLVLVEGPPGAGKTRLLAEACEAGRDAGVRVLSARGSEFEREFPFGIVRQLFETLTTQSSRREQAELGTGIQKSRFWATRITRACLRRWCSCGLVSRNSSVAQAVAESSPSR